jgi:hypothetical protein
MPDIEDVSEEVGLDREGDVERVGLMNWLNSVGPMEALPFISSQNGGSVVPV